MSGYDSIRVEGEFISEHYLAEEFAKTVRALRKDWAERESTGQRTPRQGITGMSGGFVAALMRYRDPATRESLSALHQDVCAALQLNRAPETFTSLRGRDELSVSARVFRDSGRVHLLVLEAHDARTVEDLLDADSEAGNLLEPLRVGETPKPLTSEAVSTLFHADDEPDQPAFILVLAGGWALLAERERWPEGRWLAVDLATVAERKDTTAAGELETVAALLSADGLLPSAEGTCLLQRCLEESVKHAVGVSQDLRDGVRRSIELVATEIVNRRRAQGLPVEGVPDLAYQLTRQSLRFLYRILFLLYAEARPELGVLPADAPEYVRGYGLDRLRELISVPLATESAKNGTHLYQSLHRLFVLVDTGYGSAEDDGGGLRFEPLRADLFAPGATPLVDEVGLGNGCLQLVLGQLLLSKERAGRDRGFVSYAQLGINQLGAVYEGLMSYSGFFAEEPLYEVARGGDKSKGTWVVPVAHAEQLRSELDQDAEDADSESKIFVLEKDLATGEMVRVRHDTGSFVFRLSGRERQRSASYYTPEVLTRCVVTHSLAELLDQNGETTSAQSILDMTVCEPALGSGAFLIEAVNQLAAQYLKRREDEVGERIPTEQYQEELQKVKAYLSLHRCYGVDLNATAVEFAEISLWLNSMYSGLSSPWFGLHLRRGNSLIGARRAVYKKPKLAKKAWLTAIPDDRPLAEALDVNEVHHFLLPSHGWGAVADTKEAKELRPDRVTELKAWRTAIRKAPDKGQQDRLMRLSRRVEKLWDFSRKRLRIAESEIRRDIDVWRADDLNSSTDAVTREDIEASLADLDGAYRRLRRAMDAWCALWYWPVTADIAPPDWAEWLAGLEELLGVADAGKSGNQGQLGDAEGWDELGEAETSNLAFNGARPVAEVKKRHPWMKVCEAITDREAFFHWELDFSPVFERGGFDLQVGNPPWVRPDWDEALTLAETDAWFGLTHNASNTQVAEHRVNALMHYADTYLDERASIAALSEHLGSAVDRPVLDGLRPDLYRCFMERTWRSTRPTGIVGLIHPETHFNEARAGALRRETYQRLRRHWQFRNQLKLFEISNTNEFGLHVYGARRKPCFVSAAAIYHPETIDRSFSHDGSGPEPSLRDENDYWDMKPHRSRLVNVDESVLRTWSLLVDQPGTSVLEARMLRPVNQSSQAVLGKIARAARLDSIEFQWTSGWNEANDRRSGYFESRSAIPASWNDVILQGPHFSVATPFAKQPRATMKSQRDYDAWDFDVLSEDAIPRTNYQRAVSYDEYVAGYKSWEGRPSSLRWRLAWRNMVDSSTVRSLHAALIPPGPMHVHVVHTLAMEDLRDLAVAGGFWASLPLDFLVKATGSSKVQAEFARRFPHVRNHVLEPELVLRTLRMNCLTRVYEELWRGLYDPSWAHDTWTHSFGGRPELGEVTPEWCRETPLRANLDRRQALVEIDAIIAIMLDITAEELCTIYRTQFGVLRKYEKAMRFDAKGRQVPGEVLKEFDKKGDRADLGRYVLPFTPVDREKDMTRAHRVFTERMEKKS